MIDLKKHTPEEFEQMSDEQFEEYTEALGDICTKNSECTAIAAPTIL